MLLVCMLLFPMASNAAIFSVESIVSEVGVGQQFEVRVVLDAQQDLIQSIEGVIVIPSVLEVITINTERTIVDFWLQEPQLDSRSRISFSGIHTDGFIGSQGLVFTLIVESIGQGLVDVDLQDVQAVLVGDSGAQAMIEIQPLTIRSTVDTPLKDFVSTQDDSMPPRPFVPLLAYDPLLHDGKTFVVFSTHDDESGVDYYEVLESSAGEDDPGTGNWVRATSPYVLQNQSSEVVVYVRATDKAGNVTIGNTDPKLEKIRFTPEVKTSIPWWAVFSAALIVGLVVRIIVLHRRNSKNSVY